LELEKAAMIDRLQSSLKASMLAKDAPQTLVLRTAIAAYRNEAVAKGLGPQGKLEEAEALAVLKRLVKSREDSVEQYTKAGRADRADAERAEIVILKGFMPEMLEGDALEAAVRTAITETGTASKKDLGKVMKFLQAAHGGNYDGKTANQIIQTLLP
jgi:uncharacterized protein YqeY